MSGPRTSSTNRNILLVTERDNYRKDERLMAALQRDLAEIGYEMIFYRDRVERDTTLLLDPGRRLNKKSLWIRRPVMALRLLRYPRHYGYFLNWCVDQMSIAARCEKLRSFIKKLGKDKNVVILSRSAGGVIASRVADETGIAKMICLGYPFKHPRKLQEPGRVEHLARLKTPLLIVQGAQDEYGGASSRGAYRLSPQISLLFANTDHDFIMCPEEWDRVITQIREFITH